MRSPCHSVLLPRLFLGSSFPSISQTWTEPPVPSVRGTCPQLGDLGHFSSVLWARVSSCAGAEGDQERRPLLLAHFKRSADQVRHAEGALFNEACIRAGCGQGKGLPTGSRT